MLQVKSCISHSHVEHTVIGRMGGERLLCLLKQCPGDQFKLVLLIACYGVACRLLSRMPS